MSRRIWFISLLTAGLLFLQGQCQVAAAAANNGVLIFVNNSAVFRYKVWYGTRFGSAQDGPALQGTDVVGHIASADVNDDRTGNAEIVPASDDADNRDSHAFFDPTDNTPSGIVYNAGGAAARDIRVRRFTVTGTTIAYGNTADSANMGDDHSKSIVVPVAGQTDAVVETSSAGLR